MSRFNIARMVINRHHAMYDDLIRSLAASLVQLGHDCGTSVNDHVPGAVNIVVGSTIFATRHLDLARMLRGKRYIVYQLEQLDETRGLLREWPEYEVLLANAEWIWDYAPSNIAYLRAHGFARALYLPPAFHASLDSFRPAADPAYDVLFLGALHPRRVRLLNALGRAGVQVHVLNGVYGEARNKAIARARCVLNVHAWDDLNVLETIRLSLLLANRSFVISETGDHNPYGDGLVYAPYDALTETCLSFLGQPRDVRDEIAGKGYDALRKQSMVDLLRGVLEASPGAARQY